jgi:hypothetical protein
MFYSVDRSGFYQTAGTLDLWQQDPLPGRPFWRLPDWFEADDLRAHVAELFPDGLSLHGWQYMVERHDFIRPTNSDALFVNHNMVVELVFEYVRRAVFPSRCSRFQSFFAWESLEMARAFRKEGQALYRVESSSIFRADQSWLTLGVQNAIASLSAHRYWSGAPSRGKYSLPRPSALWSALIRSRAKAPIAVWVLVIHDDLDADARLETLF